MQLKALQKVFQGKRSLLIFTHDHPDPDCIASGLLLSEVAAYYGLRSKIVYGGNISRAENQVMIELLKVKMFPYEEGEESAYDLTAIVDTQKDMGNNGFPVGLFPDLTFDHHASEVPCLKFYDIDSKWGATASILVRYYKRLYEKPSEKVATAYCYALICETKDLGPDATSLEVRLYKEMILHCNQRHLSKIRHSKKPASFIGILQKALRDFCVQRRVFYCYLGEVDRAECLAEVADLFISIEDIDFVLIVATYRGQGMASARTALEGLHLGRIMQRTFHGRGKAGGHEMVGAGQFVGSEKELIASF